MIKEMYEVCALIRENAAKWKFACVMSRAQCLSRPFEVAVNYSPHCAVMQLTHLNFFARTLMLRWRTGIINKRTKCKSKVCLSEV